MTQHRKRLKKLMQSIGIQRNDFERQLFGMRNYDEWDYETIANFLKLKQNYPSIVKSIENKEIKDFFA